MHGDESIDHLPTREGYDHWSEIYDGDDNPLVALEEPVVGRLLGDVRGKTIADVGCGTGRHALALAAAGAAVTALDFSEGMLARARAKPGADNVRWLTHDLHTPLPLPDAAFDRVLCALVLDHIADLAALLAELRRIVRPAGVVVVTTVHPAMMLRGVRARFTHPVTGRETRPASCSHSISDYINAIGRSGLRIDRMSEHAVDSALAARLRRAAKYLDWPMLLALRLAP